MGISFTFVSIDLALLKFFMINTHIYFLSPNTYTMNYFQKHLKEKDFGLIEKCAGEMTNLKWILRVTHVITRVHTDHRTVSVNPADLSLRYMFFQDSQFGNLRVLVWGSAAVEG